MRNFDNEKSKNVTSNRLNLYLNDDQFEKLSMLCEDYGLVRTEMVRRLIEEKFEEIYGF